jgi:UDP-N-acetylmuramoyl-tripeptide--D-alanyl-D-alanine ligase
VYPLKKAVARIEKFTPMKMRMERVQLANGVQLINDSYNANPNSMMAALKTVSGAKRAGRFIAVLGDMFELGPEAVLRHQELGKRAKEFGVDRLFAFGGHANDVVEGAAQAGFAREAISIVPTMEELSEKVAKEIRTGDIVLVKGSRGMKMERVVEFLKNEFGV